MSETNTSNVGNPVDAADVVNLNGDETTTNETATAVPENKAKRAAKKPKKADSAVDRADEIQAAAEKKKAAIANEKIVKSHMAALNAGWKPEPAKLMQLPNDSGKFTANTVVMDRRLQMRATGKNVINVELVAEYGDVMKDRVKDTPDAIAHGFPCKANGGFPALKAVRITDEDREANNLPGNVIVWDGFHTGFAARDVAGLKEFPVEIANGTFRFAKLLALGANASHGAARSDADRKYVFRQIVEDADLLADAITIASKHKGDTEKGGLNRALAIVAGVSKGAVSKWLHELGKTTRGNKIVDLPAEQKEKKEKPATESANTPEQVSPEAPVYDKFTSAINLHTAVERTIGELMADDQARDVIVSVASEYGFPIEQETVVEDGKEKVRFNWPAFDRFVEMMDTFAATYKNKHAPQPEPTATEAAPEPQPAA